jgi:hypothetical protein
MLINNVGHKCSTAQKKAEAERQAQLLHTHAPNLPQLTSKLSKTPFEMHLQHSLRKLVMANDLDLRQVAVALDWEIRWCPLCRENMADAGA